MSYIAIYYNLFTLCKIFGATSNYVVRNVQYVGHVNNSLALQWVFLEIGGGEIVLLRVH